MKCPICNSEMEKGSFESISLTRPLNMFYISDEEKNKKGFFNKLKAKTHLISIGFGVETEAYRCEECGKVFTAFDIER